ncbi:MAG: methyltransferase domain-containing protein [Anaerolineae bacterium]
MDHEPAYWGQVAEDWQGHRQGLWRAHMDAVNSELLSRWLREPMVGRSLKTDLFDEALGDGLMPLLRSQTQMAVGMDVATATVSAARARHEGLMGVSADVRALPFGADTLAVIVSDSTLDHLADLSEIAASLAELARVLQPGGELLLTLDNLANPLMALRAALPWGLLRRLGLVPYYVGASCGPDRLKRMVQNAGLQVIEVTAILHGPRVLGVALAKLLAGRGRGRIARLYLRALWACERLGRWPTRFQTGHYVALRAIKPGTV